MRGLKRSAMMLVTTVCIGLSAAAQWNVWSENVSSENGRDDTAKLKWLGSAQIGGALAFGDDSYNVFTDFKNACGWMMSVSIGREFSDMLSARMKMRMMHLYSRVNLESMEANIEAYPELYPRDGFYGYSGFAMQAEGMLNLAHFVNISNPDRRFNAYLIGGLGLNVMSSYDPHVEHWKREYGKLDNGFYYVDTDTHYLPCLSAGLQLNYRVSQYVGVNVEAMCTFTTDNMEGVKSEEFYDAYVSASAGLTVYF